MLVVKDDTISFKYEGGLVFSHFKLYGNLDVILNKRSAGYTVFISQIEIYFLDLLQICKKKILIIK